MSYRPVFQAEEAYHPRFQEGEVFSSGLHEGIDVAALRDHNIAEAKKAAREHIDNQEITVSRNIKEQEEAAMGKGRK